MWIVNARLIDSPGGAEPVLSHLEFDGDGFLIQVTQQFPQSDPATVLDVNGDYLSLGGVDLQINGALGLAFPDLDDQNRDRISDIGSFLWAQGVDAYAPTLVTTSIAKFQGALGILDDYMAQASQSSEAQILGAHLEGPCLNFQKRGAHPEQHLKPLTPEVMQAVVGNYGDRISIITLAPEIADSDQTLHQIKAGLHPSTVISLGHSLATDDEATQAFEAGATMVTHAFNAMPALHHRAPGLLTAALTTPTVWSGFIADGQHVAPSMLKLLVQSRPESGLFLVSDALSPLGLPDGDYPWDDRTITVTNGTARLPDGTLSGTTRPLLDGVKNLVKWGCSSVPRAIALATVAPRHAMGLPTIEDGMALQHFLRWTYQPETLDLSWERCSMPQNA